MEGMLSVNDGMALVWTMKRSILHSVESSFLGCPCSSNTEGFMMRGGLCALMVSDDEADEMTRMVLRRRAE
jgi:hypothetical protein